MTADMQEDGDQSTLSSQAYDSVLSVLNDAGAKFHLLLQKEPDAALMHLFAAADVTGLKAYFKPELLYYRALPNRLPIISLVLAFAQRSARPRSDNIKMYKPILNFLLEKGARFDAKDIAGQTALHFAVLVSPTPALAEVLLNHRADPNMRNRTGASPLINAVQVFDVSFHLLPQVKVFVGIKLSALYTSMRSCLHCTAGCNLCPSFDQLQCGAFCFAYSCRALHPLA